MIRRNIFKSVGIICIALIYASCNIPTAIQKKENKTVPTAYTNGQDTVNSAEVKWKEFFTDPYLISLIDTALKNNQELNITTQEIQVLQNDIRAKKGEYLPFIGIAGGAGVEKTGRYTKIGAMEATTEIEPGKEMPDPVPDFMVGAMASWELDVWNKLHNAKKSAVAKYLSSVEGRNFMVTTLVAEIANSYYELMALDNQLTILQSNIQIQQDALEIVKLQKEAAQVTELAVRKFEAEVFKNQSRQFYILQAIRETENRINFLVGRFPQPVLRNSQSFNELTPTLVSAGIPSQLLQNRPDIKQAELELVAAKLDIKVAKANFYPSVRLTAGVGLNAFNPQYLVTTPQSLMYSLAGDLIAPLINRNAIKASYNSASARQVQAAYNYEQTILQAYIEVVNQLSNINNLDTSYSLKEQQVQALTQSINISTSLFKSARADYMEVLMTQRDALESKFELVETKMQQMKAMVSIYRALGGGWR